MIGTTHGAIPPADDAAPRLYILDLLRFAAAALVLGYHLFRLDIWQAQGSGSGSELTHALAKIPDYGWMGAELFFMISGFVICMSSWGRSLGVFFISRVTRLLPAYVFAVILTYSALATFPPAAGRPRPEQVLGNLTMIQELFGIRHLDYSYWTLLVELKFYLAFAIVVFLGLTYRRVVAFCVLYTTLAVFAEAAGSRLLITFTEPGYTSCFVTGVALYLIYRYGSNLLLWGIVVASAVLSAISLSRHVDEHIKAGEHVDFSLALALFGVLLVAMIAVALGWLGWVRWRGLAALGALTYPVYLLHQTNGHIVIRLLRDDVEPWLLLTCLVSALFLVSGLVHRWVERPMSRLLRQGLKTSFEQLRSDTPIASRLARRPTAVEFQAAEPQTTDNPTAELPSLMRQRMPAESSRRLS